MTTRSSHTVVHHPPVRVVILLGGWSTRMGSPKHLLPVPANISTTGVATPLLLHLLAIIHMFLIKYGDPLIRTATLSVRDEAQHVEIKQLLERHADEIPIDLKIDYVHDDPHENPGGGGPAQGLLAASRLDGLAHWIVIGCDYPLVGRATMQELVEHHWQEKTSVTCFVNKHGRNEPLLAVWSPHAMDRLRDMAEGKKSEGGEKGLGPSAVLRELERELEQRDQTVSDDVESEYAAGLTTITPTKEEWMMGANTKQEWNTVLEFLRARDGKRTT